MSIRKDEKLPSSLRVTVLQKVTGQRGDVENFVFLLLISERKNQNKPNPKEPKQEKL